AGPILQPSVECIERLSPARTARRECGKAQRDRPNDRPHSPSARYGLRVRNSASAGGDIACVAPSESSSRQGRFALDCCGMAAFVVGSPAKDKELRRHSWLPLAGTNRHSVKFFFIASLSRSLLRSIAGSASAKSLTRSRSSRKRISFR